MKHITALAAITAALLLSGTQAHAHHDDKKGHPPALAQKYKPDGRHQHNAPAVSPGAATKEYEAVAVRMHKDMAIAYSGDADVDFARGMIPHHQAAIDMARIVLAHGRDPQTKKLAKEIIAAQEKEIAVLNAWLKKKEK